jgi:hypothetical protein
MEAKVFNDISSKGGHAMNLHSAQKTTKILLVYQRVELLPHKSIYAETTKINRARKDQTLIMQL